MDRDPPAAASVVQDPVHRHLDARERARGVKLRGLQKAARVRSIPQTAPDQHLRQRAAHVELSLQMTYGLGWALGDL